MEAQYLSGWFRAKWIALCIIQLLKEADRSPIVGIRMLRVTETLMAALKHLRLKNKPRKFWVDAICINQDDKDELNLQVPLMSKIYSEAQNVCVWLGERDDTSSLAMKLLPKIRDLEDFEEIIDSKTTSEEWDALIKLMQKEWFRRRWVVQEIALARRASIYCGKDELSWSDFSEAIALFQDGAHLVNAKFKGDAAYRNEPDYVGNVSEYPASRLVAATSRVVRKSEDNDVMMKVESLEYLVSTLTPFEATESADSIYAVLSLAKDVPGYSKVIAPTATIDTTIDTTAANGITENNQRIEKETREGRLVSKVVQRFRKVAEKYPVDYKKPFTTICTDFLDFVFRTSHSLDMICRPWAPKTETALPSWILTLWDETHVQHRKYKTMIRKRADILVGAPGQGVYSASGRYPAFHKITTKEEHGQMRTVLTVEGFVLDVIAKRDDAASAAVVPESWFEIGGWDRDREEPLPEAFWRTLVADRDHEGRNPPAFYPLACKHALGYFHNRSDSVDVMRVADRLDETVLKRFIQRLQAVIWGRRLARTKRDKFLSLVPSKTVEKDLICIVAGISVPVILRQRTSGPGYEFIGEAYVHGMMDGEAFEVKRRLELEWERLELY
ncbi:heterokaryon incompatibility protein-domain-containing protein [Lophiotrema nucula]|uniref:Heterokaryon incompatibility protein-domain-containing protein n=1 Tax=Lophiotrema nucula TaxID=690887 RepID=A0A6A5ZI40_9PLEO|nr:heterokaryon incompatibility protein-domain-containing protein [Lophiotrema nucula]